MAGNGGDKGRRTKAGESVDKSGEKMMKAGDSTEITVSVIMPVYNGTKTLPEALTSALKQETDLEILLVDDGSEDDIDSVLGRFQAFPQIRYMKNKKRLGAAGSRNRAVREARGRYVAFLDSDDIWAEGKLKKQLAVMERGGYILCCTARELLTPEGKRTGRVIGVKQEITYRDLLRHNSINCSSVLLPAEIAREFPMEHEDSHEDYITWLKILEKYGKAAGINEPLLLYRLSNTGKSGNKLKSAAMTFRAYRYMGFGWLKSLGCFGSYAVHGVVKYLRA